MKIDNRKDIERLIAQTENEQLEFKESTGQLERGMETLCAFLNGKGGFVTLIFRYGSAIPASTRQVTIQVEMLVQIIQKEFYSVREMMGYLQLKDRENFLNNYLNPAIKAGMVEPLYPDQPKHPRQKYRLTEKGKAVLKKGGK